MKLKKLLALALCLVMALPFAACASNGATGTETAEAAATEAAETEAPAATEAPAETEAPIGEGSTHTVTDNIGNAIEVPNEVNRIVIISTMPLASVYVMVAGSGEKLVGLTPSSKNAAVTSLLYRVAPELENVSTTFAEGDAVNVEEVMTLEPDVVFYNTNNASDVEAAAQLVELGVPTVGFSTTVAGGNTIETVNGWVELLGAVLGEELQADAIISYGRDIEAMVKERVATVPEEERKTSLILANYNPSAITAAGNTFGQYWLSTIGTLDVATEIDAPVSPVNLEQIYAWDPDIIFLNSFSAFTADDILNSTAVEGQDWSGLSAVKSGEVYKMPLGMYYWFPPCSDTPLALEWLAKTTYPELFEDIDMDAEIKDYYSAYYGVTLTDEDLNLIYNPPAESAMG